MLKREAFCTAQRKAETVSDMVFGATFIEALGRTMTPALKLNEHERKALLSWIWKCFMRGISRMMKSIYMTAAPRAQAASNVSG